MSAVAVSRSQAERVSWSVAAVFFVIGLSLSAWFTQIPQFKAALSLDDAQLGAALLCPVAGALASMQVAGRAWGPPQPQPFQARRFVRRHVVDEARCGARISTLRYENVSSTDTNRPPWAAGAGPPPGAGHNDGAGAVG
jgi:hypothetical protein